MNTSIDSLVNGKLIDTPLWWEDAAPQRFSLDENVDDLDVLVVGSGYAGLCCALELAQSGMSVLVVDSQDCGEGASTRNAGFLSGRTGVSKQINLEALVGRQHAGRIFAEADEAYEHLKSFVTDEGVECHMDDVGRFTGAHTPAAFNKLAKKMAEYNRDGDDQLELVSRSEQHRYVKSDFWYGGMFMKNAGTLHGALYHRGIKDRCIKAGVKIVTNNRVRDIQIEGERKRITTDQGVYMARQVVLATNGYTDNLSPWHRDRIIPISSNIVASEEMDEALVRETLPTLCPVIDTRRVICFARPSPDKKRILFGGRARFSPLSPEQTAQVLHAQLMQMFPHLAGMKITHSWSGVMGFTFDFLPKIGTQNGIHYAIGCNGGCGIVMMSWLGRQVARKILGNATKTSAFENIPFKTQPFYSGKPWFLPVVGNWWRMRDWWEMKSAMRAA